MIIATFVATSCTDFVEPAIPYSGFETGTYLKTITAPAPINFFFPVAFIIFCVNQFFHFKQ